MTNNNGRARRRSRFLGLQLIAALLSGCGVSSNMLPAENFNSTSFASYDAVESAYDKVNVGETNTQQLAQLGFNVKTEPNVETLSYVTVMQRFMPDPAIRFESLPPPVQKCFNAEDHCSAMLFHPVKGHAQRTGGVVPDFLGFERVSVDTGWTAEVLFLVEDGTVVYKLFQGKPKTQEVQDLVQPLGPATNLGEAILRAGKHFGGKF